MAALLSNIFRNTVVFPPHNIHFDTETEQHQIREVCVRACSVAQLCPTPWTVAHQAPRSKQLTRQEYWIGLPCPPPGDLPDPGTKPNSPALAGGFCTTGPLGKPKRGAHINEYGQVLHESSYRMTF